jgi:hypothetical protein
MDSSAQLRRFSHRLFMVTPFFLIASWVWIALLNFSSGENSFSQHYKDLLDASPLLKVFSQVVIYSFTGLILATFAGMLLALNKIFQADMRARWLKPLLPPLFIIIGLLFAFTALVHTPPDGSAILIFFVVLAFLFTQLYKFSTLPSDPAFHRWLFITTALAYLAMALMFFPALVWLAIFLINSSTQSQPWLNPTTVLFMLGSLLTMGIALILPGRELVNCVRALRRAKDD